MNKGQIEDIEAILSITTLVAQYGFPVALKMVQLWATKSGTPTLEEIKQLKYLLPEDPEVYFK